MPHRRAVLAGLASLPALASFAPVRATEILATKAGDVGIHPVAHASMALSFGEEVFYVDPAENSFDGLPAPTAILITHAHGDHYNADGLARLAAGNVPILVNEDVFAKLPEALKPQARALKNGEDTILGGVPVKAVPAYNISAERAQYHPKGVGNGYVLTFGDRLVYVAGDTEPTPEMLALTSIAIAFLPMNLPYTMSIEQAAEAVKAFRPQIVYPYHSRGSDVEAFRALVGDAAEVRLLDWYPA